MTTKQRIFLVEDHHEALGVWRKLKISGAPLVHVDAHMDFAFYAMKSAQETIAAARDMTNLKRQLERLLLFKKYGKDLERQTNLANYIYPALRDGIARSFDWIVPGGKAAFRRSRKVLERQLSRHQAQDPSGVSRTASTSKEILTKLCQKDLRITALFSAPPLSQSVLLDIDVDFLLFKSARAGLEDIHLERTPWIYPKELVSLLNTKFPQRMVTTIAYSVNGGYTPIEYKFFGDEIALRLGSGGEIGSGLEKVFDLRNRGVEAYLRNDLSDAADSFRDALVALTVLGRPERGFRERFSAHLSWWLFRIYWSKKEKRPVRNFYQQAVRRDPSLRVADNNRGPVFLKNGDLKSARREFEKILYCDPYDADAFRGVGDVFFRRKQYAKARDRYKKAIRCKPDDKKALLGLAECFFLLKDFSRARRILPKLLKADPLSGSARRLKAEMFAQRGDYKKALRLYKEAVILGPDRLEMYPEIFRILKIEKDPGLLDFFRGRYKELRKRKLNR